MNLIKTYSYISGGGYAPQAFMSARGTCPDRVPEIFRLRKDSRLFLVYLGVDSPWLLFLAAFRPVWFTAVHYLCYGLLNKGSGRIRIFPGRSGADLDGLMPQSAFRFSGLLKSG